MIDKQLSEGE